MIRKDIGRVRFTEDGAYIAFKGIDLAGIQGLSVKVVPTKVNALLEVRIGSVAGTTISKASLLANEKESDYTVKLNPTAGVHDLYFVPKVEIKRRSASGTHWTSGRSSSGEPGKARQFSEQVAPGCSS